jgi:hypothetical protein
MSIQVRKDGQHATEARMMDVQASLSARVIETAKKGIVADG